MFNGLGQDSSQPASAGTMFQCPDGSTVADPSMCPAGPSTGLVQCPDGSTATDPSLCSSVPTMVQCPDGSMASDPSLCTSSATSATSSSISDETDGFLSTTPVPTSADIASFLKLYSGDDRVAAAQQLIISGVDPNAVSAACRFLDTTGSLVSGRVLAIASCISALASGFHGVRRNHGSIGWGLWWFLAGGMFPILTPVLALGQGFGRPRVY